MVENLVIQITDTLVKDTKNNKNERLIVQYGLEVMVTMVLQTAGFLAIGLIFNRVFELNLIIFGFASLRIFAGGYHANSRMKCFLSSLAIFATGIYIYEANAMKGYMTVIPIVLLSVFAPKDHKNKRLSVWQKRANRRWALELYVVVVAAYAVFSGQERWLATGVNRLFS